MSTTDAWLALARAPGLHADHLQDAAKALGPSHTGPAGLVGLPAHRLRELGLPEAAAAWLAAPDLQQLAGDARWLAASGATVVGWGSAHYPPLLAELKAAPACLYVRGAAERLMGAQLAIVGSRNPTPQGENNARQFAKAFGEAGLCVVSGLALGIDGAAHDGALLGGGDTIAVVGTGLDRVYPKKHLALAHRIARQGMLISEFPLGTPPLTANFPKRNRIISGLSLGTLVVEAALKSGSLITARLASEQGKEVFAIPGSIHSPQSRGCHALIKQGAKLVEVAQDVLEELRLTPVGADRDGGDGPDLLDVADGADADDAQPSDPQGALLAALGFDPVSLDALQARCGQPTDQLQAQLLELELDGQLARLPGGLFQRLAAT